MKKFISRPSDGIRRASKAAASGGFAATAPAGVAGAEALQLWLAAIVQQLPAGVLVVEAPSGRIILSNARLNNLVGYSYSDSDTIFDVFPYSTVTDEGSPVPIEERSIVRVLRTGQPVIDKEIRLRRPDGRYITLVIGAGPIRSPEGEMIAAVVTFTDVTELKETQERLGEETRVHGTLSRMNAKLAQNLGMTETVQTVTDAATELSGAQFGAFFYNVEDDEGERYTLYALSGAPSEKFERFPMPRNTEVFGPTFRGEGIVRSGNIRKDPRYGKNRPYHGLPDGHLPVTSYLAVPVMSRAGEVRGGLFLGHEQSDMFTEKSEEVAAAVANAAAIAMGKVKLIEALEIELAERRRMEQHQELLLNELNHRVKNTLATIQSIAYQTLRDVDPSYREAFAARLVALADAHDLLTTDNRQSAPLDEVLRLALQPHYQEGRERFVIGGPPVMLSAKRALALGLVFHELATNAAKYGAFRTDQGRVHATWHVKDEEGPPRVLFRWQETGGPPVEPPVSRGFGSRLIERGLPIELSRSVRLEFPAEGVLCEFELPLEAGL